VACLGALRGCTCLASCVMHRVSGPEPRSLGAKLSTDEWASVMVDAWFRREWHYTDTVNVRMNGLQSWSMLGLDANGCRGERNAASGWEISGRDVVGPAKLSTALARGADGVWDGRDGVACLGALRGCTCLASCVMHRVSGPEPRSLGAKLSTDPARGADGVWDGRDGVACLGALRGCTCSASRVMHRVRGPEPWTTVHRTSYAKPCDARVGGGKIPCSPTQPRSGCHRAGPPCRSRMQALPGATATTPARRCRPALYKPTHQQTVPTGVPAGG